MNTLFSLVSQLEQRPSAELIVLPFWESESQAKPAASLGDFARFTQAPVETKDFKAKEGESSLLYLHEAQEPRLVLLGLGKEERCSLESLRLSYARLTKLCNKLKVKKINCLLPHLSSLSSEESLKAICEGILLSNYKWDLLRSKPKAEESAALLEQVTLIGLSPDFLPKAQKREAVLDGVYLARDLINGNADDVTPNYLARIAEQIAKKYPHMQTTIFDKTRIEQEGMGLLLAVGQGAVHDPAFIVLSYQGDPNSKDHTVLIGKGVTFDTGGLNLKPTGYMETMRGDMSGAAAVLATLEAVGSLELKCNVTAIVAAAENAIGSYSFKPGDVYRGYGGKTVEIGNTDAEGRLTLADAISYAVKHLEPSRIIDLATLTGAMVVALGDQIAGMLSNNEDLAERLLEASLATGEHLWRMPLFNAYREQLHSDVADIKNIGGKSAGGITAALFLEEFVEKVPWAHLDIAGPAFLSKELSYSPKNGVGFGVRLLVHLLEGLSQ